MKETTIEEMKQYIRENNLTHLVRELNSAFDLGESAIEYVYDGHTMTKEQFNEKYWKGVV